MSLDVLEATGRIALEAVGPRLEAAAARLPTRSGWRRPTGLQPSRPTTSAAPSSTFHNVELSPPAQAGRQSAQQHGVQVTSELYRTQQEALKKKAMEQLHASRQQRNRGSQGASKIPAPTQRRVARLATAWQMEFGFDARDATRDGSSSARVMRSGGSGSGSGGGSGCGGGIGGSCGGGEASIIAPVPQRGWARRDLIGRPLDPSGRPVTSNAWPASSSPPRMAAAGGLPPSSPFLRPEQQPWSPTRGARGSTAGALPAPPGAAPGRTRSEEPIRDWAALEADLLAPGTSRFGEVHPPLTPGPLALLIQRPAMNSRRGVGDGRGAAGGVLVYPCPPSSPRVPLPPMGTPLATPKVHSPPQLAEGESMSGW